MKVRGERECRECGTRWSYYETGEIECPDCGALRSVGVADRAVHTDSPAALDLGPHRSAFADARGALPTDGVADLKRDLRGYLRKRGFIKGGELLPLDARYLAAGDLLEAVDVLDRTRDPTDADREYFLTLLAEADDGGRPGRADVPEAMREARGVAVADAVDAYRQDLSTVLDELADLGDGERDGDEAPSVAVEGEDGPARVAPARAVSESLRDRTKRVSALGGDVDPDAAAALVEAANGVGEYVRTGDDDALDRARRALDDVSP